MLKYIPYICFNKIKQYDTNRSKTKIRTIKFNS